MPLGLIIESLVAVLLILTIVYCIVLNSRLKRLRADEEAMRATIGELITATEIAERAILGLKSTANDCDQTLSTRLEEASTLCVTLKQQIEGGDAVVNRLAQITRAAQAPMPPRTEPVSSLPSRPQQTMQAQPVAAPVARNPVAQAPAEAIPMTPHMLLKAAEQSTSRLRSIRETNGVAA
ncbi:DUF6468 domain-containing protein [Coralliovum pocilloporae]|uniref:DUF6468 domain-containing protein n=1 Tax=Coralliovum pocilloporae TaxID=3066369 RepID=UPI003D9C64D7